MTIRGMGGGGDYPDNTQLDGVAPWRRTMDRRRRWLGWALSLLLGALFMVALKLAAHGGCSLPPAPPLDARRNLVCASLHRDADCLMGAKKTMAATIDSDETTYRVYIAGSYVGEWPIAGGLPIDPSLLTQDMVNYSLQFQMGSAEVQGVLESAYHCRRVAYVDRVMTWELGRTTVLIACAS